MSNISKKHRLLAFIALVGASLAATANTIEPLYDDCVSINQNMAHITERIGAKRFRMPNENAQPPKFNWQQLPAFNTYLDYTRQLIEARNPKAFNPCPVVTQTAKLTNSNSSTKVADLVAPFELKQPNSDKAILLIHGLTDSPFVYHNLAYFYYQQGFTVRTLLLPGHGTAAGDLLNIHRDDWRQATAYGIKRMEQDFEQIYLGGYSTGAALIFDYLADHGASTKVKGIFSWAPASKVNSSVAWLAKYIDYIPFLDWLGKEADIDFAKYESFPINAAGQVDSLMTEMTKKVITNQDKLANIPTFTVFSQDDQTIDAEATIALINSWHAPEKRPATVLDTAIFYGDTSKAQNTFASTINVLIPSCESDECQNIKGIAHTAATSAPNNPHYGINGNYRSCGHYSGDEEKFHECKTGNSNVLGALSSENIKAYPSFQRLTYNPYFKQMTQAITEFIAKVERR